MLICWLQLNHIQRDFGSGVAVDGTYGKDALHPASFTGVIIVTKLNPIDEIQQALILRDPNARVLIVKIERRRCPTILIAGTYLHKTNKESKAHSLKQLSRFVKGKIPSTFNAPSNSQIQENRILEHIV